MCVISVIKIHAFIYFLRPPPWYGTDTLYLLWPYVSLRLSATFTAICPLYGPIYPLLPSIPLYDLLPPKSPSIPSLSLLQPSPFYCPLYGPFLLFGPGFSTSHRKGGNHKRYRAASKETSPGQACLAEREVPVNIHQPVRVYPNRRHSNLPCCRVAYFQAEWLELNQNKCKRSRKWPILKL